MTLDEAFRADNQEILGVLEACRGSAQALIGCRVQITSGYNGQMFGSSRKSLKGKIFTVADATVSNEHGIIFWVEGYQFGCPALSLDDVKVLEEE